MTGIIGSLIGGVARQASLAEGIRVLKAKLRNPTFPAVFASSSPTVTVLADNAVTTIPNAQFVPVTDNRISVVTGQSSLSFQFAAGLNDGISHNFYKPATLVQGTAAAFTIEFCTDEPRIEFLCFQGISVNIWLDDAPCQSTYYSPTNASDSALHIMQFDFSGVRLMRKIRIEGLLGGGGFAGFYIGPYGTLFPPSQSRPAISFLGDSYLQKNGNVSATSEIAAIASWALGCKVGLVDAVGGTGYAQNNAAVSPTTNTFFQRIGVSTSGAALADIFCVLGGINDPVTLTIAQVAAVLSGVRALYPNAIIVIAGNWQPDPNYTRNSPPNKQQSIASAIKAAVNQLAGPWIYISNLDDSWINSSGASKAATGIPWQTGDGWQVTFTAALTSATSGTLTQPFSGATGTYNLVFGDLATVKSATLTNNSTSVTWSGATTQTNVNAGVYKTTPGNSIVDLSFDGTHPTVPAGADMLGRMLAERMYDAIMAL